MEDKTKLIGISDRVLILEISHKMQLEQILELKKEGKILQEGLEKINTTITNIKNWIIGGISLFFIQQFGVIGFIKAFFL